MPVTFFIVKRVNEEPQLTVLPIRLRPGDELAVAIWLGSVKMPAGTEDHDWIVRGYHVRNNKCSWSMSKV